MDKNLYDYHLPDNLLAKKPASPRDFSKIFVYDTKKDEIIFDKFLNIDKYLPEKSFLVLNNTKVMPARVSLKKENGGKIKILFFINEFIKNSKLKTQSLKLKSLKLIRFLVDKKIKIGEKIYFNNKDFLEVVSQDKNIFTGKFDFSIKKFYGLLEKYGEMPIPLYLRKTPLKKDELFEKYQTIFASKKGSIAAPTASLHFTRRVFKKLEKKGIKKYFVTLHVGMGTFAPVTEENLKLKKLHEEYYEVESEVWEKIIEEKNSGKKLVAVGTTVTRALESAAKNFITQESHPAKGGVPSKVKNFCPPLLSRKIFNKTSLFIFPPYDFKMVDVLITNFHLPKSSLMMLVEAFLQHKKAKKHLIDLYNIAIKNDFRFYSFGDCMLIK